MADTTLQGVAFFNPERPADPRNRVVGTAARNGVSNDKSPSKPYSWDRSRTRASPNSMRL